MTSKVWICGIVILALLVSVAIEVLVNKKELGRYRFLFLKNRKNPERLQLAEQRELEELRTRYWWWH